MQRVMLRYYMCLRIQHTSKECCVHSKTFFKAKLVQSTTTVSFPLKEIVQSLKKCSTILCNMFDTLSKEYCVHLRTFFTGKTLSSTTTSSIGTFYYTETVHSFTTCPTGLNYFTQCVWYSLNQILHPRRTVFTGKILSKSCSNYQSILLQSNVTCSQRNTPPFLPKYPRSVSFQVLKYFVWICQN